MLFGMFGPTVGGAFRRPATRRYPYEPYVPRPGARGRIVIEYEKCNFCLLCDRRCPTHAITVDRPAKRWQIDRLRCIQCGRCVEVCPKDCLTMSPESPQPADSRTGAVEVHEPGIAEPREPSPHA